MTGTVTYTVLSPATETEPRVIFITEDAAAAKAKSDELAAVGRFAVTHGEMSEPEKPRYLLIQA